MDTKHALLHALIITDMYIESQGAGSGFLHCDSSFWTSKRHRPTISQ